jgi:hypothetical protein
VGVGSTSTSAQDRRSERRPLALQVRAASRLMSSGSARAPSPKAARFSAALRVTGSSMTCGPALIFSASSRPFECSPSWPGWGVCEAPRRATRISFSGNLSSDGAAVYQTNHGAASDLAGTDWANPIGQILSLGMLLRESFGLRQEADAVDTAVAGVLREGWRTADLGGRGGKIIGSARWRRAWRRPRGALWSVRVRDEAGATAGGSARGLPACACPGTRAG